MSYDPPSAIPGSVGAQPDLVGTMPATGYFLGWLTTPPRGESVKVHPSQLLEAGLPALFSEGTIGSTVAANALLDFVGDGTGTRGIEFYTAGVRRARIVLDNTQKMRYNMYDAAGTNAMAMMLMEYRAGSLADPHTININPDGLADAFAVNLITRGLVQARNFSTFASHYPPMSGSGTVTPLITFRADLSGWTRAPGSRLMSFGTGSDAVQNLSNSVYSYMRLESSTTTGWTGPRAGFNMTMTIDADTILEDDSNGMNGGIFQVFGNANLGGIADRYGLDNYGYGNLYSMSVYSGLRANATYWRVFNGCEWDNFMQAGSSATYRIGNSHITLPSHAAHATRQNVCLLISADENVDQVHLWESGLTFGEHLQAGWPFAERGYGITWRAGGATKKNVAAAGIDALEAQFTGTGGSTGGGFILRGRGTRLIPGTLLGTTGASLQVGHGSLTSTAAGISLDTNYEVSSSVSINTPGSDYFTNVLVGTDQGVIVSIDSVINKTLTGATQTNPIVATSVAHGLADGTTFTLTGVVGMTQLNQRLITMITNANPGVVTSVGHGLPNGTRIRVAALVGCVPLLGNLYYIVRNRTADTFTMEYPNGTPIDTTNFSPYVSGGTIKLTYAVTNATADTFEIYTNTGGAVDGTAYSAYTSGGVAMTSIPDAVSLWADGFAEVGDTTDVATIALSSGSSYGSGLTVDLTWTPQTLLQIQPSGGITRFGGTANAGVIVDVIGAAASERLIRYYSGADIRFSTGMDANNNWVVGRYTGSSVFQESALQVLTADGKIRFGAAASFSANGAVATLLTGIGPTGANTTVQEWLTVVNPAGTVRYIPCF